MNVTTLEETARAGQDEQVETSNDQAYTDHRAEHLQLAHLKMSLLYAAVQWPDAFGLSDRHDQADTNEFLEFIDLCSMDFENAVQQHGYHESGELLVLALDRLTEPIFMWAARHFTTLIRCHVDRSKKPNHSGD